MAKAAFPAPTADRDRWAERLSAGIWLVPRDSTGVSPTATDRLRIGLSTPGWHRPRGVVRAAARAGCTENSTRRAPDLLHRARR